MVVYLTPESKVIFERTEEWLASRDPVDKPEEALIAAASEQAIDVRAIARDGESFLLRASFSPCRIKSRSLTGASRASTASIRSLPLHVEARRSRDGTALHADPSIPADLMGVFGGKE